MRVSSKASMSALLELMAPQSGGRARVVHKCLPKLQTRVCTARSHVNMRGAYAFVAIQVRVHDGGGKKVR
jgi:hypothetical protein